MRGKQAPKRKIDADVKYNSFQIAKFINYLMNGGKKSIASNVLYKSFDIINDKYKKNPLEIFDKAIKNVSPVLEVKGRRIGGATYQIPVQVRIERRFILASKWIIETAKARKGKSMEEKLAEEFINASDETGAAIKKKYDIQKVAEANRAFAHFARY